MTAINEKFPDLFVGLSYKEAHALALESASRVGWNSASVTREMVEQVKREMWTDADGIVEPRPGLTLIRGGGAS